MKFSIFSTFLILIIGLRSNSAQKSMFCNKNDDCLDKGICQNNLCQCQNGFIYNSDYTKCLKIPSSPTFQCEDTRQCLSILTGDVICQKSNVNEGFCTCKEGYRRVENHCTSKIKVGNSCKNSDDCNDGYSPKMSMICQNNICLCNKGFYERVGVDCRPLSEEGEFCIMDSDCSPNVCNKSTMKCEKKTKKKGSQGPKKSFENQNEATFAQELDEICSETQNCKAKNSFCALAYKKCLCMEGFTYDGQNCVAQVGSKCDKSCAKNAQCLEGTCQCKKYYINGPLHEKCYKPARGLDESCTHDYNCYTLGDNAFCNNYKCQCKPGYKYDKLQNVCFKVSIENDNCANDEDCSGKVNSHCDLISRKCICNEGYHTKYEQCFAELGSKCDKSNCDGDHIICSKNDNICICENGFAKDNKTCIKEVSNLDQECEKDLQCDRLLNNRGECVAGKCQCRPEYQFTNETETPQCLVKKYMGDMCRTPLDCKVVLKGDHVVCRNSLCACDYGFNPSTDGNECISSASANIISWLLIVIVLLIGTKI